MKRLSGLATATTVAILLTGCAHNGGFAETVAPFMNLLPADKQRIVAPILTTVNRQEKARHRRLAERDRKEALLRMTPAERAEYERRRRESQAAGDAMLLAFLGMVMNGGSAGYNGNAYDPAAEGFQQHTAQREQAMRQAEQARQAAQAAQQQANCYGGCAW